MHIINDTQALFEYCIILRKQYRKALTQLNILDKDDTRDVFASFVFEFHDVVEENIKLLDNYVAVEKTKLLVKMNIEIKLLWVH